MRYLWVFCFVFGHVMFGWAFIWFLGTLVLGDALFRRTGGRVGCDICMGGEVGSVFGLVFLGRGRKRCAV